MKLIEGSEDPYLFQLARREKDLLLKVLSLYPRVPAGHQPLSRAGGADASSQRLLEDALAETRSHNRKELEALMSDPHRLRANDAGWRLALSAEDLERLLQILNDIRVGSWILLGSPDPPLRMLNEQTAADFWAMEMAGSFQMHFLELLEPGK